MNYITHFCKSNQCLRAWVDEDLYNSAKPPSWKYCPECVEKGAINPTRKPQDPELLERMRALREKAQIKKELTQ